MSNTKLNKLFKKQKVKKAASKKRASKPLPKKGKQYEDKVIIESLKGDLSQKLNDKEMAKKAALIIEEMIKSKKNK